MQKTIRTAFINSLTIFPGYMVLGIGFGILLNDIGYGPIACIMASGLIYAGSMQYVMISLISTGASIIQTALMTLMVNIRHLFYGISMLNKYKNTEPYKPYLIFGLTDETFSIVVRDDLDEDIDKNNFYLYITLFDQVWWILGSMIGNILGNIIPFNTTGIDFSMTALFVVIVVSQWESNKDHVPAIVGLVETAVCLFVFGTQSFLIPSMIAISITLLAYNRVKEDKHE